jgi:16S rRNA (uracil1498-N3)-methyltransferase
LKGYVAAIDKRLQDAEDFFRRANDVQPMQPELILGWTQALFQDNQPKEAEELALQLIGKDKGFGPVYDLLYRNYRLLNRQTDAENILKTKVRNNPTNSRYAIELALQARRNEGRHRADAGPSQNLPVRFRILEELPVAEPAVRISLLMSLIKFERFEWMIEKATELGVATIVPVQADRSEKGLELAARKRVERWRKVARAASQQARRVHLPEILAPVGLARALSCEGRRIYLEEAPGCPLLLKAVSDRKAGEAVAILVGPEGGWTDRERAQLVAASWAPVSLGPHILRAETAAIAAVAVLSHAWEAG